MPALRIQTNSAAFRRGLSDFQKRQIPYAAALAINGIVMRVQAAETAALPEVFDNPNPFTMRAFAVRQARKTNLRAVVFAKDIQAAYLAPFVGGGRQALRGKKGLPVPKNIRLNQYGNLTRGKLAALKAKPNVFFGKVQTRAGEVSGIWQRVGGPKAGASAARKGRPAGHLRLLIRWTAGAPVHQQLHFAERARRVAEQAAPEEWAKAWAQALATAR